jgi:hypothetical protein
MNHDYNQRENHAFLLQGFVDTIDRIRTNPLIERGYIDVDPKRYFHLFRCVLIDLRPVLFPTRQDDINWESIISICKIYTNKPEELIEIEEKIKEEVNSNTRFFGNSYLNTEEVEIFFNTYINGDGHHYNPQLLKVLYTETPLGRSNAQKDILYWAKYVSSSLTFLSELIKRDNSYPKLEEYIPNFDRLESYQ